MKNMQRISKQGYTPSKADIYHLFHSPFYQYNVPFETRLTLKRIQNEIRIVNIRETQLKKLSPLFEQATIIMVIDLSTYDIVLSPLPDGKASDKTTQNKLLICLSLLDNILDPKWLFRGPLIVHLMYHDRLAEKLDKDPFQNYFPGYKGANSVKPVVKYFRKLVFERFQLSDPSSKRITAKFCPVRSSIDSKSLKRLYQIVHVAHVDC